MDIDNMLILIYYNLDYLIILYITVLFMGICTMM
jgi:hypothetical protein